MTKWWQKISTKYPWQVLILATIVFVGLGWYASGLFGNLSSSSAGIMKDTQASIAQKKLEKNFGVSPSSQVILFERKDAGLGEAISEAYQAEVTRILVPLKSKVISITTYASTGSDTFISRDKTATYAAIATSGSSADVYEMLSDFASKADQSKLKISVGGEAASMQQTVKVAESELIRTELFTLPILLILLVIFFRSVVAALVPIGISVLTIIGAFAITNFVSNFLTIDSYAVNVITILGVGLSIDYALLSVMRFREELTKGGTEHAVRTIIKTSGHTIIFSGVTVIACLLSLLVFPIEMMRNIAIGGASAVATGILVTIIVLPSVLQIIGKNIDKLHVPFWRESHVKPGKTFWAKIAGITTSHPIWTLVVGIVVVIVALLPLINFLPGPMDSKWLARDSSSHYVSQYMDEYFDIPSSAMNMLVTLPKKATLSERLDISCDVTEKLSKISGVKTVISATPVSNSLSCDQIKYLVNTNMLPVQLRALMNSDMRDNALKFDVIIKDEIGSKVASQTLEDARAIKPETGELFVGGTLATYEDNNKLYFEAIPWSATIIVICMLVLLSVSLRSIILPVQAVVINSIALAISIAVIVGIFQLGWFSDITDWQTVSGITLAAMVLVISIAFGLAMDYSVFLYSRMREVQKLTEDPKHAIQQGVIKTGPIITAAALALFVVVAAFSASSILFMQIIGIGLAVAVLVDAFFVRLILVPSIMALMGKISWYSPKWLLRRKKR